MRRVIKIESFSWLLATAFLVCGILSCRIVAAFSGMFSSMGVPLPQPIKAALFLGPYGWLALAILGGIAVVVKDLKFGSRWLNPLFTLLLCLGTGMLFYAFVFARIGGMTDYIKP